MNTNPSDSSNRSDSEYSSDVWRAVIADMEQRRRLGIEIYGQPVEVSEFNTGQYLYEELLDAAVYLKTLLLSGPTLDDYQSQLLAHDSRFQLLILAQNLNANSDDLQQNLALALRYIAQIAKFHGIKLSDLSQLRQ
ncbi:hypothetical protein NG795_27300 [Laspinema sp. D3]|nr:hypothetical protein [Laspinema sp. D2c]